MKKPAARPAPSVPPSRAPLPGRPVLLASLLVGLTTLAYLNSFHGQFVFDDETALVKNQGIRSLAQSWLPPESGGLTVSGRPLLSFSFALNYASGGYDVGGYHLVNLLIHLANGLLFAGIVRRTLALPALAARWGAVADQVAFIAAAWWLLHPLQTESVTYIVQRAESLVALCYFGAWWFYVCAAAEPQRRRWPVAAVVACLAGMASKEVMATAPLVLALYDRLFLAGSWREVGERRGRLLGALAATWILLAALVIQAEGRGGTAGFGTAVSAWEYALTQFPAITHYLRLAVWPAPLVLDHGTALVTDWFRVLPAALLVLGLAGASAWAVWRGRAWGFCGLFFFLVIAPSSSVVPVATQTMAEHRTYLPLAGLSVLAAAGLVRLAGRRAWFFAGGLALVFGTLTVLRNADYASPLRMYEDIAAKRPDNARALALLADYHQREGNLAEAQRWLERSVELEQSVEVMNNLGSLRQRRGDFAGAQQVLELALARQPGNRTTLSNLGNTLVAAGRIDEGIARFREALRADPEFAAARYNLANTLAQSRRFDEAVAEFRRHLAGSPADAEAHANLAGVLAEIGRPAEAIVQMQEAVRFRPDDARLRNTLGVMLARAGRLRDARDEFLAAVRLAPDNPEYRNNAALAERRLGGG